ncbi:MAG: sugar phosphate isomerase/epimerase [Pseudorhodoplanes sp.]|nr:sugar phosphate isomerase/epimerase [Pseudorhodoplanes sp.]
MKISLCNEVIAQYDFARQCDFAARLGYDGIELAPYTISDDPTTLTASERARLRKAASDSGIAITSLHYLMRAPAGLSITSGDDSLRRRTVDVMRGLCAFAADLGATVLVHGSPDQRKLEKGSEAEGRKRGIACFAAVADAAAAAGVVYCIEPLSTHQTAFINTVAEAAAIVGEIGSPAVRTMIDCSAAALTETQAVPDLVRRWVPAGLIGHVHLNDPNRRGPGEGSLAFAPILSALRAQDYRGNAAIEPFVYEPDGPACAARGIGYIRGILAGIAAV